MHGSQSDGARGGWKNISRVSAARRSLRGIVSSSGRSPPSSSFRSSLPGWSASWHSADWSAHLLTRRPA
jgi:hypothetical protein